MDDITAIHYYQTKSRHNNILLDTNFIRITLLSFAVR